MPLRWCWEPSEEEALEVALQHVRWAQGAGLTPRGMLTALGEVLAPPRTRVTWLYVTIQLAECWRELRRIPLL